MSYVINRYNGSQLLVLEDGTLNTSTSVGLLGRNYTGYGEVQNENFVHLLENFANTADRPPGRPISGQIWYNSTTNTLRLYDGANWKSASAADVSATAPEAAEGVLWFNSDTKQLFVYQGSEWKIVGPEAVAGFGNTKAESKSIRDTGLISHAVILLKTDNVVQAIIAKNYFTINALDAISGFTNLVPGLNISTASFVKGNVIGNSDTSTKLQVGRKINGVTFDGTQDVTISAPTANRLIAGDYISGNDFDGSIARLWSVDASANNVIGKVVARDSQGNFAAGTITANLVGNVEGNVTATEGTSSFNRVEANEFVGATLSGNADTASRLKTPITINGVSFNGSTSITVPAAAETLTGERISNTVVESSLTTVGTLNSLSVASAGIGIDSNILRLTVESNTPYISSTNSQGLVLRVADSSVPSSQSSVSFMSGTQALSTGADQKAMIAPSTPAGANLGSDHYKFNKVYSNYVNAPVVNTETINSTAGDNSVTVTSNLVVEGNLVVNGNTTTINSTQVSVEDLVLTLASNASNPTTANGAGIFVAGASAQMVYSVTGNKWTINRDLDAGSNNFITTGEFRGTATSARYADLAENYVADHQYEPGTVVEFGGEFEVTLAEDSTTRVAGVVSTNPAYLMNSECAGNNVVSIALQGRVPCKVRGIINKGDMLVSAGSGFARKCKTPALGSVIGKALEDFSGVEGVIEVVVGRL